MVESSFRKSAKPSAVYVTPTVPILLGTPWLVAGLAMILSAPRAAVAMSGVADAPTSQQAYNNMVQAGVDKYTALGLSIIVDPIMLQVTHVNMAFAFDPQVYLFDQAHTGPLGAFSVGGDAPPANPGIGTQPMHLLPAAGYSPGAALPGSILTYGNTNGLLTIDYLLGSPVTVNGDVNFFRLDFDYVKPIQNISLANSTVTYSPSGPGGDLTELSFACSTQDGANACGSPSPSTGVTFSYATTPEPSTVTLVLIAMAFGAITIARRSGQIRRQGS
jgi:hypothetical protein